MKFLLVILLALALGVCEGSDPVKTSLYLYSGRKGYQRSFEENVPDLVAYNLNDRINSVIQTGLWIYYEHVNYNNKMSGAIHYFHGPDVAKDFPDKLKNRVSSLRSVKTMLNNDKNMITLYAGEKFSGDEFYTPTDKSSIGNLAGKVSSVIIAGRSPWTLYTGTSYTGEKVCVFPTVSYNQESCGQVLDLGFYPEMAGVGLASGAVKSVKLGCFAERNLSKNKGRRVVNKRN